MPGHVSWSCKQNGIAGMTQYDNLLSDQLESCEFLWHSRTLLVHAANIRLLDLVTADERLEAYVDALRTRAGAAWTLALEAAADLMGGRAFVRITLGVEGSSPAPDQQILRLVGSGMVSERPASDEFKGYVGALAWVDGSFASSPWIELRDGQSPAHRAIAAAVCGARRGVQLVGWAGALSDPSPLVRARAYRTTGQLGRADLLPQLRPGLTDPDPECRFWSAWAAARMGAAEPLDTLADIAWNNLPRAVRALDILLRRLDVPQANAWLREFAKLPGRQRDLIRATGVIGDPLYIPWLIEHMADNATARLAGEAFSMITGLDLAYRDLDRRPPADFHSGPNDDPADENVALDEDENLPWPDPARIGAWWAANRARFSPGTAYFLGTPKASADWLEALSDAFQRQRHAAALELAIRQPDKAMFEVRARGRLQRQLIARARGLA